MSSTAARFCLASLLGASMAGCVSTGALRAHLSEMHTCPADRVTVERIPPPRYIPAQPPAEIAADPERLAQLQRVQAERAKDRAGGTFYLAHVCGQTMVLSCAPMLDEDSEPVCLNLESNDEGKSALDGLAPSQRRVGAGSPRP